MKIKTTTILTKLDPANGAGFYPPGMELDSRIAPNADITISDDGNVCTIVDHWPRLSAKYKAMNNPEWLGRYESKLRWFKQNSIDIKSRSEIDL